MKNKIFLAIFLMAGSSVWAENNVSKNFETTAKIENFCSITTNDINFGVVSLPLTAQSANSKMNILCSNNTVYKVDLVYGGTYVDPEKLRYVRFTGAQSNGNEYHVITEDGKELGRMGCGNSSAGYYNHVYFQTKAVADLYGAPQNKVYGSVWAFWMPDVYNACNAGVMTPKRATQGIFIDGVGGDIGAMSGLIKKDKLAYKITLPGDSTKVWKKGLNSHNGIGNGLSNEFTINATIVPDSSSSKYVAADSYLDTVRAEVIY